MAKVSMIQRELKREKLVKKYLTKRAEIKKSIQRATVENDSAWAECDQMQKLPRDALGVRVQRRCSGCGRPRGVYRKFGLCRLCLRKYAMQGFVPGLEKASW